MRKDPLCIILMPTRELVIQVTKEINNLNHYEGEFKVISIYGGIHIAAHVYLTLLLLKELIFKGK